MSDRIRNELIPKEFCVEVAENVFQIYPNSIFHVHTRRCKHASDESDEDYIMRAIELGAEQIVFTDHVPFPENPLECRMDMEELPEYLETLSKLQEQYRGKIDVQIGLEIEYFPSYEDYYMELSKDKRLQWLIIGQHFYEHEPGRYSRDDAQEVRNRIEPDGIYKATMEALGTDMFRVIAHPDRAFRKREAWTKEMEAQVEPIIRTAIEKGVALEQNYTSMRSGSYYWKEFWEFAFAIAKTSEKPLYIIKGYDAHDTYTMGLKEPRD